MSPETRQQSESQWWQDFFSSVYGGIYHRLIDRDLPTEEEVELVSRMLSGAKAPILDLACGYGRILNPLSKLHKNVFGLDYSNALLSMIPARTRKSRLVRGDMRRLPFAENSFSGVFLLFNSFGYFSAEENISTLIEIHRILQPGGLFLIELPSRVGMKKAIDEHPAATRVEEGFSLFESYRFDTEKQRMTGKGIWETKESRQEWSLDVQLYTPAEMIQSLKKAGFKANIRLFPAEEIDAVQPGNDTVKVNDPIWNHVSHMLIIAQK